MPKCKKAAKEFTVGVNYYDKRGHQSSMPKPTMDALGNPDTIKFVLKGEKIEIVKVKEDK
jgi:hypothetical protein